MLYLFPVVSDRYVMNAFLHFFGILLIGQHSLEMGVEHWNLNQTGKNDKSKNHIQIPYIFLKFKQDLFTWIFQIF